MCPLVYIKLKYTSKDPSFFLWGGKAKDHKKCDTPFLKKKCRPEGIRIRSA
jgi:hypothetical protein